MRAGEGPFYNPETTDTAWLILHDFASGLMLGITFTGAAEIMEVLSPIRGHEMAEAAIENAIWDVQARHQGLPWHRLLGGTQQEILVEFRSASMPMCRAC